jgi:hypothetical protein
MVDPNEILHRGFILLGVLGGVRLLLGIYSLGILGVNYTGLVLMILAFGLFIAEVLPLLLGYSSREVLSPRWLVHYSCSAGLHSR